MNHFGSRVLSLLLAIVFLLGAAGVSFFAVFRGTTVFAAEQEVTAEITEVDGRTDKKLNSSTALPVTIEITDTTLKESDYDASKAMLSFDDGEIFEVSDTAFGKLENGTYEITLKIRVKHVKGGIAKGKISYIGDIDNDSNVRTFSLDFNNWISSSNNPGTLHPDSYYLQSYRFYDEDGDLITKLKKGQRISELILTIKEGGVTEQDYNDASKSEFSASLNYGTFKPDDHDRLPSFSNATDLGDGYITYKITFSDLRYTGETKEIQLKVGYPQSFGLERREFTESIPEGELYEKKENTPDKEESSSSEVEIDPPTPRLIITDYDYGGGSVTAASNATLTLHFTNVSRRVPVENVVVKVTMPEAFALTSSSNSFYFERVGRERDETISITFTVKPTAEPISQSIKLNFAYEAIIANKRTALTSDEEIAIPVSQVNRVTLNTVETPQQIYIGDTGNSIEATFVNKGKTPVYNVTASIEGENLAQPGQVQFIGNMESGVEKTADFTIEGVEAGPVKGEIILTFEDANMHVSELRTPFATEAIEMDMGMGEDENMNSQPDIETESTSWYQSIPGWYWAVGGLIAIIVLCYLVKMARMPRLTLPEDDDEDF